MTYSNFIEKLSFYAEEEFASFQRKLIFTNRTILGVRTPTLRRLAKEFSKDIEEIFSYPDEYYETVFIKLTIASALPYQQFLAYLERCIALMDNWALCDSFKAKCIRKNKEKFLSALEELFTKGGEYFERYVLVVLLNEYVEEQYLPRITKYLQRANTQYYYVHMAVAWLVAEILIKEYDAGLILLKAKILPPKTHNKAIQKAIESYRLNNEQKEYLRSLKMNTK